MSEETNYMLNNMKDLEEAIFNIRPHANLEIYMSSEFFRDCMYASSESNKHPEFSRPHPSANRTFMGFPVYEAIGNNHPGFQIVEVLG